jgi:hypothetical protein
MASSTVANGPKEGPSAAFRSCASITLRSAAVYSWSADGRVVMHWQSSIRERICEERKRPGSAGAAVGGRSGPSMAA